MLIVIVIIGILAAALIPRLTGIQSRARDVARAGDLTQLTQAIAIYALDNSGEYPNNGSADDNDFENITTNLSNQITGYLNSIPTPPQS